MPPPRAKTLTVDLKRTPVNAYDGSRQPRHGSLTGGAVRRTGHTGLMASWDEVMTAAPDLAQTVQQRFTGHKHHTMATLRADGSPRISGTEVEFVDGRVVLGSMPDALKAKDLQRDPRVAIHSQGEDPPADDPSGWSGEAKISGTATEVPAEGHHRFEIGVTEVVFTKVEGDELVVWSWHANGGERTRRRR